MILQHPVRFKFVVCKFRVHCVTTRSVVHSIRSFLFILLPHWKISHANAQRWLFYLKKCSLDVVWEMLIRNWKHFPDVCRNVGERVRLTCQLALSASITELKVKLADSQNPRSMKSTLTLDLALEKTWLSISPGFFIITFGLPDLLTASSLSNGST